MGKRGPKSKYDPNIHPQLVKWMCRSGLTNEEIAGELHLNFKTLLRWSEKHEEMREALKTSRELVDSLVEDSLLKRALGYEYEEIRVIAEKQPNGEPKPVRIEKTKKLIVPDTTAQIFWLKNRQRQRWTDVERNGGNTFNIMQGVLIVPGER